ncbi:HepT-like ribonuclease domain-containing protein [Thermoflexus sp.]
MVRFRNLVVHLYHEVEPRRVYEILQTGLDDLRSFIAEVWAIVGSQRAGF